MQALIAGEPQKDPAVGDVAEPTPAPGEVTVRVEFAGVNFADVMALRGDYGYAGVGKYVPGLEAVGIVDQVGPGVERPQTGQRVTAYLPGGGFAEVAVVSTAMLVVLPDVVSSQVAACVPVTLSTAHLLLEDVARVRQGDRLLVHSAAGGMGLALARLAARHLPLELLGTVTSDDKRAMALDGGYDQVFLRDEGLVAAVQEATAGRGATIILGALGTDGLGRDIQMAAPTGRIVRFGNAPGLPESSLPKLADLNAANVSIAGFSRRALAKRDPSRVHASFKAMVDALAGGEIDLRVTEVSGLEALPSLLSDMSQGATLGKFVVRVGTDRHRT